MQRLLMMLVLATALGVPAQAAELFKWTDASGRVYYSDRPPPPEAKSVERKKPGGNFIEGDAMPFATKMAAQKYPVTLYSFDICGEPCAQAEAMLNKRGVPYTLKNREEDKSELKRLTGDTQVPVLIVGNQPPSKGFEEGAWNKLLDLAGYPKSNPFSGLRPKKPGTPATIKTEPASATSPQSP